MAQSFDVLLEKWDPVLSSAKVETIKDDYRAKVTAQLLENTERALMEQGEGQTSITTAYNNGSANIGENPMATYDPVLISMVRRMAPKLIAYDLCGVQPMTQPTGLIFAMKSRYSSPTGAEALFDEANTGASVNDLSQAGGTPPWTPAGLTGKTIGGMATKDAEGSDNWQEMSFSIERTSVTAQSRQLKASYSREIQQDLRAVHGVDAEQELANILSQEITTEINREIIRTVYFTAKNGASWIGAGGVFDLDADADGRWSVEKYKGLHYAIERDMNAIAVDTRRGKGNVIVCSADVASALMIAGQLDSAPALQNNLTVDPTGATFAGTMRNGAVKVYIDPYATGNFYVVGYKGSNAYDAGFFYCPYVPLQQVKAIDPTSFQPVMGFKTRYGVVANPFTTLGEGANSYYRRVQVVGL